METGLGEADGSPGREAGPPGAAAGCFSREPALLVLAHFSTQVHVQADATHGAHASTCVGCKHWRSFSLPARQAHVLAQPQSTLHSPVLRLSRPFPHGKAACSTHAAPLARCILPQQPSCLRALCTPFPALPAILASPLCAQKSLTPSPQLK